MHMTILEAIDLFFIDNTSSIQAMKFNEKDLKNIFFNINIFTDRL
jgi:hypothetical protein